MIINRNGYGSNFNILKVVGDKIVKCSLNVYGKEKLMNESTFYEYILKEKNGFCDYIPIIYKFISVNYDDFTPLNILNGTPEDVPQDVSNATLPINQLKSTSIEMEFLKDYTPLYLSYGDFSSEKRNKCLKTIMNHLQHIHNIRIPVEIHVFKQDLFMETIQKIEIRMKNVLPLIQNIPYKNITYIQNNVTGNIVKIRTLDEIKYVIKQNVDMYLNDENTKYEYGIIHGDCQFNNILINKNDELKFIDPRGYYGSTQLYGLVEYDIAKICFALSGYDTFDNSQIEKIIMSSAHTIQVDIELCDDTYIQTQSIIVKTLLCAIWLSNSHIFLEDEPKCITSYFIAMYMCSQYLFG